jgi:hypothetical protein
MEKVIFDHFDNILGSPSSRCTTLNLEFLQLPQLDPVGLDSHFTEEEVWSTIRSLHPDMPRLDGFTLRFL